MTDLFIRMQDGVPVEHPILGDNFYRVFPNINVNALPPEFARFERVEPPLPGVYEVVEHEYVVVGGVVKDEWTLRSMTLEEITQKQDRVKSDWAANGFASWIFVEQTCSFVPPVPRPNDGNKYRWDEDTTSWDVIPSAD